MRRVSLLILMLGVSLLWGCATAGGGGGDAQMHTHASTARRVAGEYLVGLMPDADPQQVRDSFDDYGVESWDQATDGVYLLRLRHDPGVETIMREGRGIPGVRYIQPNNVYTTQPAN